MKKRGLVYKYESIWFVRKVKRKLFKHPIKFDYYAGKQVMELQMANDWIAKQVLGNKPFMAARFGSTELGATWIFDSITKYRRKQRAFYEMKQYSGFFAKDIEYLEVFASRMDEACGSLDLLAVWFRPMEDYMVKCYGNQCNLTYLEALEPWYVERPWTAVLRGKKVLVIHPFAETIRTQYQKREKLFPGTEILPEFSELHVVKAVQTLCGEVDERFQDWFEALEWMFIEAMKLDFDIAIIGCGAYGFLLAEKIKKAGRQAVHMGGATQLLFGIKGQRWDNHPIISKLYNEHWVRPSESERPARAKTVEGGCYW